MPKSETSTTNTGPSFQAPRYRPNWFGALMCFVGNFRPELIQSIAQT